MIRVTLYRCEGCRTGYRAEGHSGYAEEGSDIVCAAVSVLGATCVNSLESVCGIVPVITENRDGLLAFHVNDPSEHDAQVLLGALKQGLTDIEEQFPANLKISILERRK